MPLILKTTPKVVHIMKKILLVVPRNTTVPYNHQGVQDVLIYFKYK